MKRVATVLAGLVVIGSICFAAAIRARHAAQQSGPQYAPIENRLSWYAKQAKLAGKNEVRIPAPEIDYGGGAVSTTLDDAMASYDVVVARPIESKSVSNDDEISTWYRFELVEKLVSHPFPICPGCEPAAPPKELVARNNQEFSAARIGGTVIVDGVAVTMADPSFPEFQLGKDYLLFLSIYPSGRASIGAGPHGVFLIEPGGTIKPLNQRPHGIKKDIESKFRNSLDGLRGYVLKFNSRS